MAVAALVVSIISAMVAIGSVVYARLSAQAAVRSADVAEIVERGRHYGWRIEPIADNLYALRNVGTINARDVQLSATSNYPGLGFFTEMQDKSKVSGIAAGQSRLFSLHPGWSGGGEVNITWTPDTPDAEPMTWTESPPPVPHYPDAFEWQKIMAAIRKLGGTG